MTQKVLITGGAGFIGSHTADALAARGFSIRILDSLDPPVHSGEWPDYVQEKGYELIRGDVCNADALREALQGVDCVYHIAAYQDQRPDFSKFFDTNTTSTARIFEEIVAGDLPVKKVILASSQFVYGDGVYACDHQPDPPLETRGARGVMNQSIKHNPSPPPLTLRGGEDAHSPLREGERGGGVFYPELRTKEQFENEAWDIACPHGKAAQFIPFREEQKVNPTNSYGLSKYALEMAGFRLGKTYGIPTTALRYSVVQGPRQSPKNHYSGALRIFVTQALTGEPITVYEDGRQERDFVNIEDVVSANLLALDDERTNFEVYNVGGGRGYAVLDFAKMVKDISGSDSEIRVGGYRRTDTRHAVSDISKLKALGWKPQYGPEKSIRDYVQWYRQEFL